MFLDAKQVFMCREVPKWSFRQDLLGFIRLLWTECLSDICKIQMKTCSELLRMIVITDEKDCNEETHRRGFLLINITEVGPCQATLLSYSCTICYFRATFKSYWTCTQRMIIWLVMNVTKFIYQSMTWQVWWKP